MEGVGKSTFATGSEKPIWLDLESGTSQLKIARYPFQDLNVERLTQVIEAIHDLETQSHDYKTLIIDTIDRLEHLVWDSVCEKASTNGRKMESIESFGYGRGYVLALQCFKTLITRLERLRRKGMTIVLLGHSMIKNYKNPEGDDYDRYTLRLHDKSASFLKEWSDVVGFMRFEEGAAKLDGDNRAKGFSTGKRFLHFQRTAAFDAKSRYQLPIEIEIKGPKSWPTFGKKTKTNPPQKTIEAQHNQPQNPF